MTYFKNTSLLTEKEKQEVSDMTGKIMLWILEGRSIAYMAEQLKLSPWQVEKNIDETLHNFRKQVGRLRFIKILFMK